MISTVNPILRPDFARVVTEEKTFAAKACDSGFLCGDVSVFFERDQDGLTVSMRSGKTPVKFIQLRWQGGFADGALFMGDAVERGYGNLEWRGLVPDRMMPWYFLASDKTDTSGFGVMVRPNAFAYWMCDRQGVTLWLDVRCGGKGVILDGKTLRLATIVKADSSGEDAYDFLRRFCGLLCRDPLLPSAPVYGGNNWYYAYGNSSHGEILQDAALLSELTEGLENRPYMVIDDCWQPLSLNQGAAGRPYDHGNIRFPDMPGLAAQIRKAGVKPGIWIRPQETNEMFIDPKLRCDRDRNRLDITEPEALRLIGEDVARVTGWGYEFVKFDFATYDTVGNFIRTPLDAVRIRNGWAWHDRSKTTAEAIQDVYRTILTHAGNAVILGCNVVGHLAAGLMHMHRSGDDTSGHSWDRTVIMGVNTLAFRLAQHKTFFHIDADCVGIAGSIPWEQNREFLRLLQLSGTPLFVSVRPSEMTEEIRKDLREAFRLSSAQTAVMKPLDWFETSIPTRYSVDGEEIRFSWMKDWGMDGFSA